MKIYEMCMLPNCQRVTLFLKEIGAEVERVEMDVRQGDNLTLEFQHRSVNGKVPVLELNDGTTMCESIAICRYFDETVPNNKALFGLDAEEKARIEMWQRVVEFDGIQMASYAFRHMTGIYSDRENCIAAWGEEAKQRVTGFLTQLDARLADSDYVAGERFTVADISAFVFFNMAHHALEIPVAHCPHLLRWQQKIASRPAFQG